MLPVVIMINNLLRDRTSSFVINLDYKIKVLRSLDYLRVNLFAIH